MFFIIYFLKRYFTLKIKAGASVNIFNVYFLFYKKIIDRYLLNTTGSFFVPSYVSTKSK